MKRSGGTGILPVLRNDRLEACPAFLFLSAFICVHLRLKVWFLPLLLPVLRRQGAAATALSWS
jgi:hypothetical protein